MVAGFPMQATERTLLAAKPSRIIVLKYYVGAIFLIALASILFFWVFRLPALGTFVDRETVNLAAEVFFLFLALVLVLRAEVRRFGTRYVITDFRIIRRDGILRTSETVFPYRQLERVVLQQGIIERIFGIGTIVVDTGDDHLLISSVPDPRKVGKVILGRGGKSQ